MKFTTVIAAILLLSTGGCVHVLQDCVEANGPVVTRERAVSGFYGIDLRMTGKVEVFQGSGYSVSVEAAENLQPFILTSVDGQTLIIDSKECLRSSDPVIVRVVLPTLRSLDLSGSGDVRGMTPFDCDKLFVNLTGSGDISVDLRATVLRTAISGSGDVRLNGKAKDQEIRLSGSGDVHAGSLVAENTTIRVSGSGDCRVNTTGTLRAAISGSGNVRYLGKPAKVESRVDGSGAVQPEK
jgi:hypothetical protein